MAPSSIMLPQLIFLFSLFFFFGFNDATAQKNTTNSSSRFLLPIVRDATNIFYFSYLTSVQLGTPPVKLNLTIDIGHQVNWVYPRGINHYNANKSSTKQPFPCTCPPESDSSVRCLYENGGCMINMCSPYIPCNDFESDYYADLIRDLITLYKRVGSSYRLPLPPVSNANLPNFSFGVAEEDDPTTVMGLSEFSSGVLSLSRSPLSLNNQLADYYKTPRKFALCLPSSSSSSSSKGVVYFGGGPYILPPTKFDLSTIMLSTDILTIKFDSPPYPIPRFRPGDILLEYMIKLTSIKIGQTRVPFNTSLLEPGKRPPALGDYFDGGSKLSNMVPYTALIGEIYTPFLELYNAKAAAMNITKVDTYEFYPLEACFNSTSIRYDKWGMPQVPVIDFMMDGNSAVLNNKRNRWRVYGSNSMVSVSKDVMCLAFVESVYYKQYGVPLASIMIGGKQMEDNLIEFDQDLLKLRFNAFPLKKYGTTCSQFKTV